MGASPWTEEICLFLRSNWQHGVSASQLSGMIAIEFRVHVTRGAVIGKASRMGLDPKQEQRTPVINLVARAAAAKERHVERQREYRAALKSQKPKVQTPRITPIPFKARIAQAEPLLIPFAALDEGLCKYECSKGFTEPSDFVFCGRPTSPDMPYCAGHCRISYLQTNRQRASA